MPLMCFGAPWWYLPTICLKNIYIYIYIYIVTSAQEDWPRSANPRRSAIGASMRAPTAVSGKAFAEIDVGKRTEVRTRIEGWDKDSGLGQGLPVGTRTESFLMCFWGDVFLFFFSRDTIDVYFLSMSLSAWVSLGGTH